MIGALQAVEALKLLLHIGEPLIGRLLLFDGLALSFSELPVQRDPACVLCGERPQLSDLIDYERFCGWS